jgi:hypothetical protein
VKSFNYSNFSLIRLVISLFVIYASVIAFAISLKIQTDINSREIESLKHNDAIINEIYINLKMLYSQNNWQWQSSPFNP